jgi:Predicted N-acetylglucosaminyl transferase
MKKILIATSLTMSVGLSTAQHPAANGMTGKEALFYQGKEMFATGNFAGCIEQLQKYRLSSAQTDLLSETDYMLAAATFQTGEETAKNQLETFLRKHPDSRHLDRVKFLLGTLSFYKNEFEETISTLREVKTEFLDKEEKADCQYRLAYAFIAEKREQEAQKLMRELQHNSPKYADAATYYLAWFDYRDKQFDQAVNGFEAVKNNPEFSENARFYLTQIYFVKHNYDAAISAGEGLIAQTQDNYRLSELYRIVGESYYYQHNTNKAVTYLTSYAEKDKTPLQASMLILGTAIYQNGDYGKAINYLKLATGKEETLNQSAFYYLGNCYLKTGNKKSALMAFESASKSTANMQVKEVALYNYAMLVHETAYSPFDESVSSFEQFLNEFPESIYADKVSSSLSEVYLTSKNYPLALEKINKIKQPNSKILAAKQRILYQLGAQMLIDGQPEDAISKLNSAIDMGKLDAEAFAEAYFWRGEAYYRQNEINKAGNDYQVYLSNTNGANKQNQALAYYNLGYTEYKQQEITKAQKSFEQFLNQEKTNNDLIADATNRIGDCRYLQRDYAAAENYYAKAARISPQVADYSMLQQAQMLGIQKQYNAKISLLDKIIKNEQSEYADDALYEKAKAYELSDRNNQALQTYQQLTEKYPQSPLTRDAGVQMAMLYFGMGNTEKSIEWYKKTISAFPGSDEANVANEDLKRIYKDQNRIDEYADFLKTLSGSVNFSATEQDSLMYLGAEKVYMKGNKTAAQTSFTKYLKSFPNGAFSLNANYYMANMAIDNKKYDDATPYLESILSRPDNKFTEGALRSAAEISFNKADYAKADTLYQQLEQKAVAPKTKTDARIARLRCAWLTNKYADASALATKLLADPATKGDLKNECIYYRAKSNLALNQNQTVVADLTTLAKDTRSAFGAESKYLLAEYYFNIGSLPKAESEVNDFISKGTPQQHWLAKSFILLVDLYIKNDDLFQAKQYLLSLKNNYKEKDEEITRLIEERMPKVEQATE